MDSGILIFLVIAILSVLKKFIGLPERENEADRRRRVQEELDYKASIADWCDRWRKKIDHAGWISRSSLTEVVTEFPPPAVPASLGGEGSGLTAEAEKLVFEVFDQHNAAHLLTQKLRLASFFQTVEKNPLTEEQVDACICMDSHVQIVAAAGSGKTATMVAKTGYALREAMAKPAEILLLAFNKNAADELGVRIRERLSGIPHIEDVQTDTFHAFGLDVIGQATGKKPHVPSWVAPGEDTKAIANIVKEICALDPAIKAKWDLLRSVYAEPSRADDDVDSYHQGRYGLATASGHTVKSQEEKTIAQWLFYNQINFEYERPYEHDVADAQHGQYHPDFYYPDVGLYHEHFALDQQGRAPAQFDNYEQGVAWKRELHSQRGTKLFETKSFEIQNGTALPRLEAELRQHGLNPVLNPDRPGAGRVMTGEQLARMIRVFMQHAKSNGLTIRELRHKAASRPDFGPRTSLFLDLYDRIADEWELRLRAENGVDFDDMLLQAAEHIEQGRYRSPFTMIFADEFQDSSRARIRLLKALTKGQEDVRLCVVGDDWQGINRFAGADISVMTEFERIFENATVLKLSKTFRCPKALCDASSAFISKNPAQIAKQVVTANDHEGVALVCYGLKNDIRQLDHLENRLEKLSNSAGKEGRAVSVLILGRYRSDEPDRLAQWKRRFAGSLTIEFRTVHSSKGLEADYVAVMNVIEDKRGFPSQVEDDPILQVPMPTPDPFEMAEERRLFYVAITRAKRQAWLYTETTRPSRFINELVSAGHLKITVIDGEVPVACPRCKKGVVVERKGPYGTFESCSTWPRCTFPKAEPGKAQLKMSVLAIPRMLNPPGRSDLNDGTPL